MGSIGTRATFTSTATSNINIDVSDQTPNDDNTPVSPDGLSDIAKMSDSELASLINSSQSVQMPNFLSDVNNAVQKFVFAAGLNEKPMVLDTKEFNQFMKDNNIPQSQILARGVNPITYKNNDNSQITLSGQQVLDTMMYSKLNYVGGKHGGALYGYGTYFDMNGGRSTGYGPHIATAVLNPTTTRAISQNDLYNKMKLFDRTHPQTAAAIRRVSSNSGTEQTMYALAMGYNVITEYQTSSGYGYHNVIDRKALVYKK